MAEVAIPRQMFQDCGNCGSSHQRQRETFDDYAFNSNQRRIAPKCQGKWSDQPLNAIRDTGMPENIHTSHSGFWAIQKSATIHVSSGVHPGNTAEI
jgi:hypothetical protein